MQEPLPTPVPALSSAAWAPLKRDLETRVLEGQNIFEISIAQ